MNHIVLSSSVTGLKQYARINGTDIVAQGDTQAEALARLVAENQERFNVLSIESVAVEKQRPTQRLAMAAL